MIFPLYCNSKLFPKIIISRTVFQTPANYTFYSSIYPNKILLGPSEILFDPNEILFDPNEIDPNEIGIYINETELIYDYAKDNSEILFSTNEVRFQLGSIVILYIYIIYILIKCLLLFFPWIY